LRQHCVPIVKIHTVTQAVFKQCVYSVSITRVRDNCNKSTLSALQVTCVASFQMVAAISSYCYVCTDVVVMW